MVNVKDISQSQTNYERSASSVPEKYKAGIRDADWHTNASSDASEELYAQKVREAISRKARQKGVSRVSNEDWRQRALDKGASQIGGAMAKSGGKWARGFQPYQEVLKSVRLPDRVADPIANVQNRVIPIVEALYNKKKQLQSS